MALQDPHTRHSPLVNPISGQKYKQHIWTIYIYIYTYILSHYSSLAAHCIWGMKPHLIIFPSLEGMLFHFLPLSVSLSLLLSRTHALTCAYITTLSCTSSAGERRGKQWWLVMCFGLNLWSESTPAVPKPRQTHPTAKVSRPRMHGSVNRSGCFTVCTLFFLTNWSCFCALRLS